MFGLRPLVLQDLHLLVSWIYFAEEVFQVGEAVSREPGAVPASHTLNLITRLVTNATNQIDCYGSVCQLQINFPGNKKKKYLDELQTNENHVANTSHIFKINILVNRWDLGPECEIRFKHPVSQFA